MTCPRSPETVANLLNDNLTPVQRTAAEAHLANCAHCRDALAALEGLPGSLLVWQDQAVPKWDRRQAARRQKHDVPGASWSWWQWAPVMASLVLALAVVFNLQISRTDDGFTVAFGGAASPVADAQVLESLVAQYSEQQLQVMNGALSEFADSTASSLEDVVRWIERQRQQDMQMLEASFQEMLEREYETVRSVQQLATYVQGSGNVR